MKLKDERAKMCNEILNGMKVIKLYAWEPPMEKVIENLRKQELTLVRKAGLVRAMADAFNTASPFLVSYLRIIKIFSGCIQTCIKQFLKSSLFFFTLQDYWLSEDCKF